MDAIKLLTGDHNRVRGLFKRWEAAEESEDTGLMAELGAKIVQQLHVHTTIEEEIFYPAAREYSDELRKIIDEGLEEHAVAKRLIDEAQALDPQDDHWQAKMKVLIESVKHHAQEEENEMFPKVRSATGAEGLADLAEQLEAKKRELGAPTLDQTIDLSKEELLAKAGEQEIPGRSSMSQEELALTVDPR